MCWIGLLFAGIVGLLLVLGTPLETVIFVVASTQGNVGLSAGPTGADMPDAAKTILMENMWIGCLEIIPVAALIRVVLKGFESPDSDDESDDD